MTWQSHSWELPPDEAEAVFPQNLCVNMTHGHALLDCQDVENG